MYFNPSKTTITTTMDFGRQKYKANPQRKETVEKWVGGWQLGQGDGWVLLKWLWSTLCASVVNVSSRNKLGPWVVPDCRTKAALAGQFVASRCHDDDRNVK